MRHMPKSRYRNSMLKRIVAACVAFRSADNTDKSPYAFGVLHESPEDCTVVTLLSTPRPLYFVTKVPSSTYETAMRQTRAYLRLQPMQLSAAIHRTMITAPHPKPLLLPHLDKSKTQAPTMELYSGRSLFGPSVAPRSTP